MPYLKRFKDDELVLSADNAFTVLRFFWPGTNVKPGALNVEDRKFAQALLLEAIEASYAMGYVEALFRSVAKIPKGLGAVIKSFAKGAVKHWFRHATRKGLMDDPKIYEIVRQRLALNFKSVWAIREQTGELIY